MGSIVMTEIKVDNIVDVAGTGKPNFPVAPTHSTGSALSTLNTYQYDTTTRVVTVVDDNGTNKFAIDGVTAPTITLLRGVTYTFDVSDSSVSTHPLAFKNAGTSYTTGVTSSGTAGTANATVTFAVAADAPLTGLTYYCTTHGDGMGSSVTTSDPKNGAMLWDGTSVNFYVDSEFKSIGTSDSGGSSGTSIDDGSTTIADYTYDNVSFDASSLNINNIFFKTDGTKVYVLTQGSSGSILEIDLSTAWDLSTATDANSPYTGYRSQNSDGAFGLYFKPDGTSFWTLNWTTDAIHQYNLSTAWDVSTASYASKSYDFGSGSYNVFVFNNDGTKLYANKSPKIESYTLSTAWDVSTASYDGTSSDLIWATEIEGGSYATANTLGVRFSPDGTSLFVMIYSPNDIKGNIYQWDLTTAYDLTTATLTSNMLDTIDQVTTETLTTDLAFSSDGTKLYTAGRSLDGIYQWSITSSGSSSSGIAWGGARGFRLGGNLASGNVRSNVIDYWAIDTPGNAQDFGDLTKDKYWGASTSSGTRVITAGGYYTSTTSFLNDIDYITCATTGNAVDFGDMTYSPYGNGAVSDGTRGCLFAGYAGLSLGYRNNIEYVTIATTGNATDQADLLNSSYQMGGWSDSTRGVIAGGSSPTIDVIQYFTIQSTSNAQDFGDLSTSWRKLKGGGDSTRSCFMGGRITGSPNANSWTDTIEYVTTQTPGNSTDFGNLTSFGDEPATACDGTYCCVIRGEYNGNGRSNVIERFTVQTTGNATDFGDLTESQELAMGAAGNAA